MDCQFLNPVNLSGSEDTPNFAYSTLSCPDASTTPILIQNASTEAAFYLSPILTYGDFFFFIVVSVVFVFWIASKTGNFLKGFFHV